MERKGRSGNTRAEAEEGEQSSPGLMVTVMCLEQDRKLSYLKGSQKSTINPHLIVQMGKLRPQREKRLSQGHIVSQTLGLLLHHRHISKCHSLIPRCLTDFTYPAPSTPYPKSKAVEPTELRDSFLSLPSGKMYEHLESRKFGQPTQKESMAW